MAVDASELLGSRQVAGMMVGWMRQFRKQAVPAQTPDFGGQHALLAVTDQELALVSMRQLPTLRPDRVIARVPRSSVKSAEVGKGNDRPLTITFTDRTIWQFEIPQPGFLAMFPKLNTYKRGQRFADLLNGVVTEV